MLDFRALGEKVNAIKNYIELGDGYFCDLTLGMKYMWRKEFVIDYAVDSDTLIMKESSRDYTDAFYFPIGENQKKALKSIEEYARAKNIPLVFCCLNDTQAENLAKRYNLVEISSDRNWSDYVYDAEKFKTYSGKKFSGQRNHVNKFKKLYPDYQFFKAEEKDLESIKNFLIEFYNATDVDGWTASVEKDNIFEFIDKAFWLGQVVGYIKVGEKIVAISVGEVVGSTLVVHVEKALRGYDGIYPTMAQEFVKAFAGDGVRLVNREEDCGDVGLRTSKLQYQPIEIRRKNLLVVKTIFDNIKEPIYIKTKNLEISDLTEEDKKEYYRLYTDEELNKAWGYDYRVDLNGKLPDEEYFFNFQRQLKEDKEEYSLAVRKDGVLIGELVLHNFDYYGGVEMGFRLFTEYQGKGYATESANALKEYALNSLSARSINCKCYKQNIKSKALIERLDLKECGEDEKYYYFKLDK